MGDICFLGLPEVMAKWEDINALVEHKLAARETEKVGKQVFCLFAFKVSQNSKLGKTWDKGKRSTRWKSTLKEWRKDDLEKQKLKW